jgi:hypothetical protein
MPPYLNNAIFEEKTTDPLDLLILAHEVAVDFKNCHQSTETTSAINHVRTFGKWAFAIHPGVLSKVRYNIKTGNNELQNFLATRHSNCIMPPLGTTITTSHQLQTLASMYSTDWARTSSAWVRCPTKQTYLSKKRSG